ncbi:hypothetical protein H0H87_001933 [Tephrocybe sp. NHM501043]|nr:hypothetical protein H0H87_001933 [Tephrocybe sp. NHM501043]
MKNIGLISDVDQLDAFAAAAGFAEAAVFHGLSDPPFIRNGWATTQFTESGQQYGVQNVPCPGNVANSVVQFQPVMFWYFHNKTDGTPEVKTVFCAPSIKAFDVTASANIEDKSLTDVTILNDHVSDNNVTGSPLDGKAFNGVIFPENPNPFIQARSVGTKAGISGAIFRLAVQQPGGVQSTFDLPNGFLDLTRKVYTQHLSIVAQSVYFVNANSSLAAEANSLVPVLWIDPFPGHALAILLIIVGIAGCVVQILHQRERRKVLLTAPPGSIAAAMSLTAHSGFGQLLLPYDDMDTLERKLSGLTFRLDRRSGAIVADEQGTERVHMGPDDAMLSLLGESRSQDRETNSSSSTLAYQAAAGYPPWKTPYDS